MSRGPLAIRQADITRAVRALKAAGFEHIRVILTHDGVLVEPAPEPVSALDNLSHGGKPEKIYIA